ncbi:MAG: SDR family oxidoreductase [Gemmatimonadaceae bacterium]|nr:SDR family oxidoreductase [Gemmatimonadaceae bacterium]
MAALPLEGRTALVTGASRGIGEACARALAALGARGILVSRREGPLRALADALGLGAVAIPGDLADPASATRVAEETMLIAGGAPDILVHAAGSFPLSAVEAVSDHELDLALALNVAAPLRLTRAFLPAMRVRGSGHVVTIGSIADRAVFPSNAAYAASKHAVRAVHETLRAETRGSGVRATIISPAATDTELWDPHDPDGTPHLPSRHEMLHARDIADAVTWAVTRPPHVDVEELRLARS